MSKSFKPASVYAVTVIILITTVFAACVFGSASVSLDRVLGVLGKQIFGIQNAEITQADIYIVWNLRLPRALLALGVGGGLAVAGAAMQSITGNVMADPYVLGISSGAMAFVSIGFLVGGVLTLSTWFIPALAFIGAIVALVLVFAVGGFAKGTSPSKLILSGMAVSITLNAVGQYCIYQQESSSGASSIVNWTMGSLGGARWNNILITIIGCSLGMVFFVSKSRAFDLIALGDETAISLGTNTRRVKFYSMIVVAIICGLSVASSGIIGLVGFMIPHIVRFLVCSEHKRVFPLSFVIGGIFLMLMDILSRTIMAPEELPVGIFTALCGGPYFIWLLRRKRKGGGK